RPGRGTVAERRLQLEHSVPGQVRRHYMERMDPDRWHLPCRRGCVERPFEAGDVRQVRQILACLEGGKEIGEARTVFDETTRTGRVQPLKLMCRIGKKALVNEPADDRKRGSESAVERPQRVIAINSQAGSRIDPVGLDRARDVIDRSVEQGSRDAAL